MNVRGFCTCRNSNHNRSRKYLCCSTEFPSCLACKTRLPASICSASTVGEVEFTPAFGLRISCSEPPTSTSDGCRALRVVLAHPLRILEEPDLLECSALLFRALFRRWPSPYLIRQAPTKGSGCRIARASRKLQPRLRAELSFLEALARFI